MTVRDEVKRELREERMAFMIVDGGATELEAHLYCNQYPELYGHVPTEEINGWNSGTD